MFDYYGGADSRIVLRGVVSVFKLTLLCSFEREREGKKRENKKEYRASTREYRIEEI